MILHSETKEHERDQTTSALCIGELSNGNETEESESNINHKTNGVECYSDLHSVQQTLYYHRVRLILRLCCIVWWRPTYLLNYSTYVIYVLVFMLYC